MLPLRTSTKNNSRIQIAFSQYMTDENFNALLPESISLLADRHWTPADVAKMAAEFLVTQPNTKVLDIGSGVGKFCLIGASNTQGVFHGVEQRANLVAISKSLAVEQKVSNVSFIHANITSIDFTDYEAFYFYNPFYENIDETLTIDHHVSKQEQLFFEYSDYVKTQFQKLPIGTRLATYFGAWSEIPTGFELVQLAFDDLLHLWIKKS
jgi:hypothetical protein